MHVPILPDIFWKGASGARYGYWIYPLERPMQSAPGNYIYARQVNGRWRAVYVGECEDLAGIILDETAAAAIERDGATHIHTHTTPGGAQKRIDEAADLRRALDREQQPQEAPGPSGPANAR
ncbi:MAG: hypothetical protein WCE44_10265 [Candidatus Velthaea sp.]|jgi:hypothetical protein